MRPSRLLPLILMVLIFSAGTVWAQQVIYGCVKNNNGQIRIVAAGESCLPSEHAIQWQAAAPSVPPPPTPPPPTTPASPGPLRVLDQKDAAVGVFVPPSNAAKQIGDLWVALPVTPAGFQLTNPLDFMAFYQTADCAGDAYLPVDTGSLLRAGFVMPGSTGQLAFSYPGKPEVDRATIQAFARYVGNTWTCYAFTPGPWMPLFGKVATIDVSSFQAPFKIVQ
jgi:hypothetical protein